MADCPLEPEQHQDGISFKNILLGEGGKPDRKALYWHYPHSRQESAVRMGDFKLIHFYRSDKVELYNLKEDIGEQNELSTQCPALAERMLNMLRNWQKNVGARFQQTRK